MRKIYTLFVLMLLSVFAFNANATDVNFTINIDDATRVGIKLNDSNYQLQDIEVVTGENAITVAEYASVYIYAKDGYSLDRVYSTATYSDSYINGGSYCYIYPSSSYEGSSVEVTSSKIEYDGTVQVYVDDASKVQLQCNSTYRYVTLVDGWNEVSFQSSKEVPMSISPATYGSTIYKVELNGQAVEAQGTSYRITPAASGDTIKITVAYPDIEVPVKFTFTDGEEAGDASCITSVTVNGESISADVYTADNFTVKLGSTLAVTGNTTDYKFNSFSVNGSSQYFYGSYNTTVSNENGYEFAIDAHKYGVLNYTINVEDASAITAYNGYSYNGNVISLIDGANELTISENSPYIQIVANSGCTISSIKDQNGTDYTSSYSITVTEGMELTVVAGKIVRDKVLTVNVHDLDQAPDYFSFARSANSSSREVIALTEGTNTINFYDGDNNFGIVNMSDNGSVFQNKFPATASYSSYYLTFADGDVLDIYFADNAETCNVEFEFNDYQSYNIIAKFGNLTVRSWEAGLKVLPGATFQIANTINDTTAKQTAVKVTVNDKDLEADDEGYYNITINEDSKIVISALATTGVNSIIANSVKGNNTVYNLQGVAIIRNASAEQIANLPAGLYIVNGKKFVQK
jgi:hypothetical protein